MTKIINSKRLEQRLRALNYEELISLLLHTCAKDRVFKETLNAILKANKQLDNYIDKLKKLFNLSPSMFSLRHVDKVVRQYTELEPAPSPENVAVLRLRYSEFCADYMARNKEYYHHFLTRIAASTTSTDSINTEGQSDADQAAPATPANASPEYIDAINRVKKELANRNEDNAEQCDERIIEISMEFYDLLEERTKRSETASSILCSMLDSFKAAVDGMDPEILLEYQDEFERVQAKFPE